MTELINKFERSKRDSNSKPVDSLYNTNIDTPKCNSIILSPVLEIKTILNSNVDNNNNNNNKVIVKKELAYITNYKDPVEITTNEISRNGLLNKERMFSQNKTNNTITHN